MQAEYKICYNKLGRLNKEGIKLIRGGLDLRRFRVLALAMSLVMLVGLMAGCGGNEATGGGEDVIKVGFLGATTGDVARYGILIEGSGTGGGGD